MSSVRQRLLEVWRSAAETGTPLPSEAILAASLSVSRPKIREELIRLESDGLVTRVPNSGTFPNRSVLTMGLRLDQSYEFSQMLEAAGFASRVEVLRSEWIDLDVERASQLGVRAGSSAFQTVKRWFADGKPVMIAVDAIPATRPESQGPDAEKTVFELVIELRGTPVAWETSSIRAKTAGVWESEIFDIDADESVLELTTFGISTLGTRLYHASESYRQDVVPFGIVRNVPTVDTA